MQITTFIQHLDIKRRVVLRTLRSDGKVVVEAIDGLKPALIYVPGPEFPWQYFLPKIYRAWFLSRPVPLHFKPLKRIPEPVIEKLQKSSLPEQMQILKALRAGGFLPQVRA
ncbi:MAG: hypothetical protein GX801_01500 [Fibrobacter sp.]|nr:hypothetical protein [Fibrobacter sp.]